MRLTWSNLDSFLTFTTDFLQTQGRAFEKIALGYFNQQEVTDDNKRITDDSWLEIILPLSSHEDLRMMLVAGDAGGRMGTLFELLDVLAAEVAYRHCKIDHIVTASVDAFQV